MSKSKPVRHNSGKGVTISNESFQWVHSRGTVCAVTVESSFVLANFFFNLDKET